jgi:hypothetical protein
MKSPVRLMRAARRSRPHVRTGQDKRGWMSGDKWGRCAQVGCD